MDFDKGTMLKKIRPIKNHNMSITDISDYLEDRFNAPINKNNPALSIRVFSISALILSHNGKSALSLLENYMLGCGRRLDALKTQETLIALGLDESTRKADIYIEERTIFECRRVIKRVKKMLSAKN